MDRSLGFGSTAYDLSRAIHTRFRYGYVKDLTLPHTVSRRLIMQKACGHPVGLPQFVSV